MTDHQTWFDWMFRSRETGRTTIGQFPNLPLGIFLVSVVARWFVPDTSDFRDPIAWIGLAALSWWALDELIRGVNPWRRLLGLCGCVAAGADLVMLLQ